MGERVIDVSVRPYDKNGIYYIADVTLDYAVRFSVFWRTYPDKETGEEKTFLAYPQRRQGDTWEPALHLSKELKAQIDSQIYQKVHEHFRWELHPPEIQRVNVVRINQEKKLADRMIVRGMADAEMDGYTIKGITIKEARVDGEAKLFINLPQYKQGEKYQTLISCETYEFHKVLEEAVLDAYQKEKRPEKHQAEKAAEKKQAEPVPKREQQPKVPRL